jgi:hypothetical protein
MNPTYEMILNLIDQYKKTGQFPIINIDSDTFGADTQEVIYLLIDRVKQMNLDEEMKELLIEYLNDQLAFPKY